MTESRTSEPQEAPTLHCCRGEPAPEAVVQGWRRLLAMRTSTRQAFLELFTTSVVEPDEATLEARLSGFCDSQGHEPEAALSALRTCRFLLERSAALDLDEERFTQDLEALSAGDPGAPRLLASRYLPLKGHIREGLLDETLADHGNVLVGLDWRLDHVSSSDRAVNLDAPVVFLTLDVRNAQGSERVSVQLTGRSIQMLRRFADRFSEPGGGGSGGP